MSLLLADYETGNSRFLSRILCVDIITYISHAKIINRPYSSKIFSMTRLVMENLLAFLKYYSYFRQLTMVCAMAYKITKRQIRFMSSDFFYYDDVIFMESGYDPIINKCIADNLQAIKKLFYKYELNFFICHALIRTWMRLLLTVPLTCNRKQSITSDGRAMLFLVI